MSKPRSDSTRTWRAPGRVNIVGEHIDYLGGVVLPFACDLEVRLVARSDPSGAVAVTSSHTEPGLARHVEGVVAALMEAGHEVRGISGEVTSSIPVGAGLSSSTALEVAIALAVTGGAAIEPEVLQRAEQLATGVPCGVMDQATILGARTGHALFLDCATGDRSHVPIPDSVGFVVVDTGTRRQLTDGRYAERRAQVEERVERSLRELHAAGIDDTAHPRVRHAVTEFGRVLDAVEALRSGDVLSLGEILDASHASLRDDFEVSSGALDEACDAVRAHPACTGARLVGAGFAGCVLAVGEGGAEADIAGWVEERLTGSHAMAVRAAAGAGELL